MLLTLPPDDTGELLGTMMGALAVPVPCDMDDDDARTTGTDIDF